MIEPQILTQSPPSSYVRRSGRDPSVGYLDRTEVKVLLIKIRSNHADTVILKLKDHLMSDINSVVLDEIILALYSNKVCQALYFQNLSKAMNDEQLTALIQLLKKKFFTVNSFGIKIFFKYFMNLPFFLFPCCYITM